MDNFFASQETLEAELVLLNAAGASLIARVMLLLD